MRYFDTTADLVALLIIPISVVYLIISMKVIFYRDVGGQLHNRNALFASALILVLLHYVLAMYNVIFIHPSGNDVDNFIFWANGYSTGLKDYHFKIGAEAFKQFLSFFYYIFGSSSLLLASIVIFVFSASLIMLLKICVILKIRVESSWFIFLFGGMPFFLLVTIEPYREMFLIFFMMTSLYYALRFRKEIKIRYLIYSIVSMLFFGLFHWVTAAIVPFLFFLFFFFPIDNSTVFFTNRIIMVRMIFIIIIATIGYIIVNSDLMSSVSLLNIGEAADYIKKIEKHNQNLLAVSGVFNYSVNFNGESIASLFIWYVNSFIFYMFKPFIWEVNSLSALVLSIEGIIRFLLLVFSIIFIVKSKEKKTYILLLFIYLFIESVWSLGTSNAGTAARHHLVTYWILVILGGGGFIASIRKFIRNALSLSSNERI